MYPYSYRQASAPPNEYATAANNNPNYPHDYSENRKYHMPNEQLMAGLDKFVRRYESKCCSHITALSLCMNTHYLFLVNKTFASKLRGLIGCEIVLICDDSGSMNTELGKLLISFNSLSS
jgi:hypothetical protein